MRCQPSLYPIPIRGEGVRLPLACSRGDRRGVREKKAEISFQIETSNHNCGFQLKEMRYHHQHFLGAHLSGSFSSLLTFAWTGNDCYAG